MFSRICWWGWASRRASWRWHLWWLLKGRQVLNTIVHVQKRSTSRTGTMSEAHWQGVRGFLRLISAPGAVVTSQPGSKSIKGKLYKWMQKQFPSQETEMPTSGSKFRLKGKKQTYVDTKPGNAGRKTERRAVGRQFSGSRLPSGIPSFLHSLQHPGPWMGRSWWELSSFVGTRKHL